MFCQLSFDSSLCRIKVAVKIHLGREKMGRDTTVNLDVGLLHISAIQTKQMRIFCYTTKLKYVNENSFLGTLFL